MYICDQLAGSCIECSAYFFLLEAEPAFLGSTSWIYFQLYLKELVTLDLAISFGSNSINLMVQKHNSAAIFTKLYKQQTANKTVLAMKTKS